MNTPRRDRGRWRRAITLIALVVALSVLLVVVAPLDGVSDRIAVGEVLDGDAAGASEGVDSRLVLQIGMLFAALYVAFLCIWLSRTRGGDWTARNTLARVRSQWIVALSRIRGRLPGRRRAAAGAPTVCAIAWKHGRHRSRFQAVISTPGDRRRRVVAESAGLRWPPKDARNPPTRELEAALASLVAQIVAAGWEPVRSDGSWTERRFVWRATNLVALDGGEAITVPVERRPSSQRVPIVVAAVLAAATAIAGVAVARSIEADRREPAPATAPSRPAVDHGGLHVRLPAGWARGDAPAITGFRRPLELANADARLVAVAERLPATSATLLPLAFEQGAGPTPRQRLVLLEPGRRAVRYRFPGEGGTVTVVLAAATTRGVTTVACRGMAGDVATGACEALASATTVPGSRPLEPGRTAAFLSRLPATVADLEAARAAGMRAQAAASGPRKQIAAAAALASAHRAAAVTLAPIGTAGDPVPTRTVEALSSTSNAYSALASAVRAGSGRGYVRAARAVRSSDAKLRRALRGAAAAANTASSLPARRVPRAVDQGTDLTVPLLGLMGASVVLLAALGAAREVRHAR
jgi:hypothetical protein